MGFGKIIGKVFASVFGKKNIDKMVSAKLNKAPIIKVGLFDLKKANTSRNVVKDFIDQAGHTDINLADLKQKNGLLAFMENQKASGQIAEDLEPLDIKDCLKSFIDQAGHTDVNLADLNKLKA